MKAKAGPEGMGFMRACPTILSVKMEAFKHCMFISPRQTEAVLTSLLTPVSCGTVSHAACR